MLICNLKKKSSLDSINYKNNVFGESLEQQSFDATSQCSDCCLDTSNTLS